MQGMVQARPPPLCGARLRIRVRVNTLTRADTFAPHRPPCSGPEDAATDTVFTKNNINLPISQPDSALTACNSRLHSRPRASACCSGPRASRTAGAHVRGPLPRCRLAIQAGVAASFVESKVAQHNGRVGAEGKRWRSGPGSAASAHLPASSESSGPPYCASGG
jgi:hypothetical protein